MSGPPTIGFFPDKNMKSVFPYPLVLFVLLSTMIAPAGFSDGGVVINEIMYHPLVGDPKAPEFVELYNSGDRDADLSGAAFVEGIEYVFPPGTVIPADGYLVLSPSPQTMSETYQISNVYGPFVGRLDNEGEYLRFVDADGNKIDALEYIDEHGWPQPADGDGCSLERRHPQMAANHYQSWAAGPLGGTPGRANSSRIPFPEPIVYQVRHDPLVPRPGEEIHVTCRVHCSESLSAVILFHRKDGSPTFQQSVMESNGDGFFRADLGPGTQDDILEFVVQAVSASGAEGRFPVGAPDRSAVLQVDGVGYPDDLPLYRIVMRRALEQQLTRRDVYSNEELDACFYAGGRVYYNVGVRYRGKGSRHYHIKSYRVDFTNTDPFGQIRKLNLNAQRPEYQLIGLEFFHRAEIPAPNYQLVSVIFNNRYVREYIQVERCDKDMMQRVFGNEEGNLYRGVEYADLAYRGENADAYRAHYVKETNERLDDYSDIIELCSAFSNTTDEEFPEAIREQINVDEWLRWFAIKVVLNDEEKGISNDVRGDDYYIYHNPGDGLFYMLPWDLDSVLLHADQPLYPQKLPSVRRLLTHPDFAPRYLGEIASLRANEFDEQRMASDIELTKPILPEEARAAILEVVHQRHVALQAQLPTMLTVDYTRWGGERILFQPGDEWKYFPGRTEPASRDDWTEPGFDDSGWESGPAGIGYGDGDDQTVLDDMRNNYVSCYMRREFEIADPAAVSSLIFTIDYDDSFIAYLNGHEVARSSNISGNPPSYNQTANGNHEAGTPEAFDIQSAVQYLVPGTNVFAIEGHNVSKTSSDFSLIPTLQAELTGKDVRFHGTAPADRTSTVTVNGLPAEYDPTQGTWEISIKPVPGINEVSVEARGADGNVVESAIARLYAPGRGNVVGLSVESDEHWTRESGPYYVEQDLLVPWGFTLTIDPGTELLLAEGVGITVYGQLFINGTDEDRIRFAVEGWHGRWKGIALDRSYGECVLRGCDFSYGSQAEGGGKRFNGVVAVRGATVTIENCAFTHLDDKGIEAETGNLVIRNCVFDDLGEGIQCERSSALIESCTFSGLRGHEDAVDLDDCEGGATVLRHINVLGSQDDGFDIGNGTVSIDSCRIANCVDKGVSVEGTGLKTFTNCLIVGNDVGIEAKHQGEIRVISSTIAHNQTSGINLLEEDAGLGGGSASVTNTILWSNGAAVRSDAASSIRVDHSVVEGGFDGEAVIDAAPLFVDPTNGVYRVREGSPCIDSGTDIDAPKADHDGTPRPIGAGHDIGAYEYQRRTGIADWMIFHR